FGDERRRPRAGDGLWPASVRGRACRRAEEPRGRRSLSRRGIDVSALLATEMLELGYGPLAVCRDISIEVNAGEIVALIGANGAGKSTTLRAIAGLLTPRAGAIRFRGEDITRLASHERALLGIALVPEGRHVFPF